MRASPDEWSDEEDDDRSYDPPAYPGRVRAAGILWILVGCLFMASSCAGSVLTNMRDDPPIRKQQFRNEPNPVQSLSTCLGILIGLGFVIAGARIAQGSSRDPLVTSILSILVGVFYVGMGVFAFAIAANPGPNVPPIVVHAMLIGGVIGVIVGCSLLLPAGLALSGRAQYVAWWQARYDQRRPPRRRPPNRRPPPRRDEFDEPEEAW